MSRDEAASWWKSLGVVLLIFGALGGLLYWLPARLHDPDFNFEHKSLQGSVRSTNKELGTWNLSPTGCVAGRELGFEGIAFQFAAGSPVEEIRVDSAREGDNVVEVRLADRKGTHYRVREREC